MVEIGDALVAIADKIGIGVVEMYHIYVEAQTAIAIIHTFCALLWVLTVAVFGYLAWKKSGDMRGHEKCMIVTMVVTIVGFVALIIYGEVLYVALLRLLCPEYMAIEEMIQIFSGVI